MRTFFVRIVSFSVASPGNAVTSQDRKKTQRRKLLWCKRDAALISEYSRVGNSDVLPAHHRVTDCFLLTAQPRLSYSLQTASYCSLTCYTVHRWLKVMTEDSIRTLFDSLTLYLTLPYSGHQP